MSYLGGERACLWGRPAWEFGEWLCSDWVCCGGRKSGGGQPERIGDHGNRLQGRSAGNSTKNKIITTVERIVAEYINSTTM